MNERRISNIEDRTWALPCILYTLTGSAFSAIKSALRRLVGTHRLAIASSAERLGMPTSGSWQWIPTCVQPAHFFSSLHFYSQSHFSSSFHVRVPLLFSPARAPPRIPAVRRQASAYAGAYMVAIGRGGGIANVHVVRARETRPGPPAGWKLTSTLHTNGPDTDSSVQCSPAGLVWNLDAYLPLIIGSGDIRRAPSSARLF